MMLLMMYEHEMELPFELEMEVAEAGSKLLHKGRK